MLSKNNHSEQIKRQMPKQQRFAIKKLTVGVASVLIGFAYLGVNQVANADTVVAQPEPSQPVATKVVNHPSADLPAAATASSPSTASAQSAAPEPDHQPAPAPNQGSAAATTNQQPGTTPAGSQAATTPKEQQPAATPTDAEQYTPETTSIIGKSNQVLANLDPNEAITGLKSTQGKTVAKTGLVTNVQWASGQVTLVKDFPGVHGGPDEKIGQSFNYFPTAGYYTANALVDYADGSHRSVVVSLTIVPMGYEWININVVNGLVNGLTYGSQLISDGTSRENFIEEEQLLYHLQPNAGYVWGSGQWSPELPATFGPSDMLGTYTLTFTQPVPQPITTTPKVVPADPSQGIKNLPDLPAGTKVTWTNPDTVQQTIDQANPGETVNIPATVTYPNGDTQSVNIPVTIKDDTKADADAYTPVTKTNEVNPGATSIPAANGIKGYQGQDGKVVTEMPGKDGQDQAPAVTWTDPAANGMPKDAQGNPIDTKVPGIYDNVPAIVTYPDGSTTKIKETIVVGNVVNVTNNDQHNHETDPVPDGYELVHVYVINGHPQTGSIGNADPRTHPYNYLVKIGTTAAEFKQTVGAEPNQGYADQPTWTGGINQQGVPATFGQADANAYYTVTFFATEPITKINEVNPGAKSIPAENGIKNLYNPKDPDAKNVLPNGATVTWDHVDSKTGMPIDPATGQAINTDHAGIYDHVPATVTYPHNVDHIPVQVEETIVVGSIIDVTNNDQHNHDTDPVPDGYLRETFNVVNGYFGSSADSTHATTKIFLVKSGTPAAAVLKLLDLVPNDGYDQGSWSTMPTDFTTNGSYTYTFTKVTTPTNPTPTNPNPTPTNPNPTPTEPEPTNPNPAPGKTDADKNTPITQPIPTDPGVLPDPDQGIKNLPDLPGGTKVTWDDPAGAQKTIDHAKPGDTVNIPATVTYPDGSQDQVTIPVTINNPQVDNPKADQNPGHDHEGQDQSGHENPGQGGSYQGNDQGGNGLPATPDQGPRANQTPGTAPMTNQDQAGTVKSLTTPANGTHPAATKRLPQTGNQTEKAGAIAGMALLTAALGLFGWKKKED